jgi:predicted dehydrogenase
MDEIRMGVIGLRFGQHHVRTLINMEGVRLVAVADRNPDLPGGLDLYAGRYGARAYRDGIEMMEREKLDAVSIATAPRGRAPLIEHAARTGIAMFVEKPWAADLDHAQRLAALCREHHATVMAAFSFRYHPAIVKLRELMDGELGPAWMLNGDYVFSWVPPAGHWLWDPGNGNGFFNENSCHLLDAVCYLLGDPISVMAEAINPMVCPSENAAAVTLRFSGGAIAALTIGGIGASGFRDFPRMDVVTSNGQARLSGREHIWERLSWATRGSGEMHKVTLPPEALGNTRYTHALRHFVDCVREGKQPSSGVEAGVKSVALAMAVYESARTGKPIQLHG